VSAEPTPNRPALGLPPRRTEAPASEAPLARMLPGHRPEPEAKSKPREAPALTNMTVSIPVAMRNRARAAFRATGYAEGDNTWSHFVAKAIEAETARREAEHNAGEMYPSWEENLPGGRRLKDG
jgi:hypothetical protein